MFFPRWAIAIAFPLLLLVAIPSRANGYDSSLHWTTLETPHFLIHYHDGLQSVAESLTSDAEQIYTHVTAKLKWQPKAKTHVILNDRIDEANGLAYPTPSNTIEINVSAPSDIAGLEDFDVWLRDVLLHEFVHIVHLDKATGVPADLRRIFGRVSFPNFLLPMFPNLLEPNWIIEGLATYLETDIDNHFGRGQSSFFRGLMREEVASGFKSLRQVNQPLVSWPGRTSWYLYGVFFFEFLHQKYGEESITRFVNAYSNMPIPYFLNPVAETVFGKNFYALWNEFEQAMQNEFGPEISSIASKPIAPVNAITHTSYFTGNAHVQSNGDLIYVQATQDQPPSLVLRNAHTGKIRTITTLNSAAIHVNRFDVHPQQGIVISMLDISNNANILYDLYHVDIINGKKTRLTHGGRYFVSAWSPDGTQIAAAKNHHGKHAITLLKRNGDEVETLWTGDSGVYVSSLAWSPDGTRLLASVFRTTHGWNLEIFDITTRRWQAVTATAAIEGQASFIDNDTILFSADYTGVYNIYQMNLSSGNVAQYTNEIGGGFYPALASDRTTLFYSALNKNGYDIYQTDVRSPITKVETPRSAIRSRADFPSNAIVKTTTKDYEGLLYSRPRWWIPTILANPQQTVIGLNTNGKDPLEFHQFNAALGVDITNALPIWNIDYTYARHYPKFNLFSARSYSFGVDGDSLVYIDNIDQLGGLITIPHLRINYQLYTSIGVIRNSETSAYFNHDYDNYLVVRNFTDENHFLLRAAFNNTRQPIAAVAPMDGIKALVNVEKITEDAAPTTGEAGIAQFTLYSPSMYKTVLSAHLLGGIQSSGLSPFVLGNDLQSYFDDSGISRKIRLRGYAYDLQNMHLTGDRVQLMSFAWHTPLARKETGIMLIPVGMNRVYGHAFMDMGRAWYAAQTPASWSKSVGAEITLETTVGYHFPINIAIGITKGLDFHGEIQPYISVGQ